MRIKFIQGRIWLNSPMDIFVRLCELKKNAMKKHIYDMGKMLAKRGQSSYLADDSCEPQVMRELSL